MIPDTRPWLYISSKINIGRNFLEDVIATEDGIGSEKKRTITLQKLNKKIYLGISITVKSQIT